MCVVEGFTYKESWDPVLPECVEDAEGVEQGRAGQEQPETEKLRLSCMLQASVAVFVTKSGRKVYVYDNYYQSLMVQLQISILATNFKIGHISLTTGCTCTCIISKCTDFVYIANTYSKFLTMNPATYSSHPTIDSSAQGIAICVYN